MHRSIPLLAAALAAVGCTDRAVTPVQPDPLTPAPALATPEVRLSVAAAGPLDFSHEVGDIVQRILPSFADADAAEALRGHLGEVAAKSAAGDRAGALQALDLARGVLQPGVTSQVDAAAIHMTLDVVQRELAS